MQEEQMPQSPSEYFSKYKDKPRADIIEFLNGIMKEQVENDKGVYHLTKQLSILFFNDVQYEGVFQSDGDFSIIHDVVLSYLQKAPLPNPIKTRDGTLIGGNGNKSETKTVMNFLVSAVEAYYGLSLPEILNKQAESTIAEEPVLEGSGGSSDDAIAIASFGIGEWGGGRFETYMTWCYANGFDPYNENVQIIYISHELINTPDLGLEDIVRSDNFTNPITAFSLYFQKDDDPDRIQEKVDLAAEIYTRYYI